MLRHVSLLLVALVLVAVVALPLSAATVTAPGKVTEVTVFQGQALVTRVIELPDDAGLVEAVVTELPEQLLAGSLYAEPGEGVEVRSVRARNRPADSAPREEAQAIETQIKDLGRQLRALQRERAMLAQRMNYLNQLEQFTSNKASEDLNGGVLKAEALRELTDLAFTQRELAMQRDLETLTAEEDLQAQLQLAQRKLATLTGGGDKTTREAVVFVSKDQGAASVRLMYLVGGAKWSPSYNVRAKEDRSGVTLEYNASVTQMSGEDWTDVEMTLSTATPSLVATSPKLEPLTVKLAAAQVDRAEQLQSRRQLAAQQKSLADNRGNMIQYAPNAPAVSGTVMSESKPGAGEDDLFGEDKGSDYGFGGGFGAVYDREGLDKFDSTLNSVACAVQVLDLQAGDVVKSAQSPTAESGEGLSIVYRLPNNTSLPSRSDQQLIQIAALPMEAEFYRVATPVLTNYVYQEAKLSNSSGVVLLAGPAATFLGDRFVGRGSIPQATIGESFTVGLGIDESLRASRELADKTDRVQGGNRIASFDYELVIENFAADATEVRVRDRLPKAEGEAIKVTLVESDPKAKDDGQEDGLLEWRVEVPASGEKTVAYTMTIEHDKNLQIVGGK